MVYQLREVSARGFVRYAVLVQFGGRGYVHALLQIEPSWAKYLAIPKHLEESG